MITTAASDVQAFPFPQCCLGVSDRERLTEERRKERRRKETDGSEAITTCTVVDPHTAISSQRHGESELARENYRDDLYSQMAAMKVLPGNDVLCVLIPEVHVDDFAALTLTVSEPKCGTKPCGTPCGTPRSALRSPNHVDSPNATCSC